MQQTFITKNGGYDVLQAREAPDPQPAIGEVRIAVKASGVNFADIMARLGMYPDAPPKPCVVGYEVSGTIDALGPKAPAEFQVGQRVFAITRFGGYASHVCVPGVQVFAMPDGMSFEEAAAIPVNYFTAHLGMFFQGNLKTGEKILIHSAGGGVGLAAIQLAKTKNAEIFGTQTYLLAERGRASYNRLSYRRFRNGNRAHYQRTRRGSHSRRGGRRFVRERLSFARAARPPGDVRTVVGVER